MYYHSSGGLPCLARHSALWIHVTSPQVGLHTGSYLSKSKEKKEDSLDFAAFFFSEIFFYQVNQMMNQRHSD